MSGTARSGGPSDEGTDDTARSGRSPDESTDGSHRTHRTDHPDPPSDPEAPLLEVGHVVKPHGLRGDVIVALATNRSERAAVGSVLTTAEGRTMTVLRSSPHRGRYIVTFGGLSGIDDAEAARGTRLYAPPLDDPDALWIHDLIGSRVEDTAGTVLGTVESVEANPASDLLVLDGGALIPLRFVVASVPGVRVTVEVPDGLLELS